MNQEKLNSIINGSEEGESMYLRHNLEVCFRIFDAAIKRKRMNKRTLNVPTVLIYVYLVDEMELFKK